jgi:hypothetical protein
MQNGAFSGAGFSNECETFTAPDLEGEIPEDGDGVASGCIRFGNVLGLKDDVVGWHA